MEITFLNGNEEFKQRGLEALESTAEDIKAFMRAQEETGEPEDDELGHIDEYGLSFDYTEPDGKTSGYVSFLMSWGGPSDEIRFYDGGFIEYVFMDWGTGIGFDVTNEDWAKWLRDYFSETIKYTKEKYEADV